MPTRKIGDLPEVDRKRAKPVKPCMHPEHNPPAFRVYEPGIYEHTCPACGKTVIFTAGKVYWSAARDLRWLVTRGHG